MESTKRKPTEDARRTKTPKLPAIVAIEKKIEALREEIVMVSATAGLARVSLNDVQRQFGSHPTLKGHLSDLDDLDQLTNGVGKYVARCVKLVKALHKDARKALPLPMR